MAHSTVTVLTTTEIVANILSDKPISLEELERISRVYPGVEGCDIHAAKSSGFGNKQNIYITGPSRELLKKPVR